MARVIAPTPRSSPSFRSLPPLSLYVHLPWCVRKCPYCDFNSHEYRGAGAAPPFAQYVEALLADLDFDLPLAWGRTVHSVFFGGGTPSLFPAAAIERILQAASARLRFAPEAEITLEANPGTAEHDRFGSRCRPAADGDLGGAIEIDRALIHHRPARACRRLQLHHVIGERPQIRVGDRAGVARHRSAPGRDRHRRRGS